MIVSFTHKVNKHHDILTDVLSVKILGENCAGIWFYGKSGDISYRPKPDMVIYFSSIHITG